MSHDSHSQTATLIKMVNQIAANLSAYEPAEAAKRIEQHLVRFWAPKMRQDLIAAAIDETDLSPLARDAIAILKTEQSRKQIA
ncbi:MULTISPECIES: formate dehydrogenase subunit delta [unclassified Methylophaga]|uniref:formate dehydrogenase subunit delta n=1 Tax=unclassified Methylophaga TaxID=2629249 RepID=UPI0025EA9988|nr:MULTISPECIES: formate dehydrogenase subunit delta [unclassified Methylophaga]|tara:strand:+ start:58883 stop:59131 length:249 start_codon:yes stop_codon:yes gene_type:complete